MTLNEFIENHELGRSRIKRLLAVKLQVSVSFVDKWHYSKRKIPDRFIDEIVKFSGGLVTKEEICKYNNKYNNRGVV